MKPKIIKEGEPFILGNTTYTYIVQERKIVLSKVGTSKPLAKPGFTPPTLDEVKAFFKEKGYNEETAIKAYEYYDMGQWKDSKGRK